MMIITAPFKKDWIEEFYNGTIIVCNHDSFYNIHLVHRMRWASLREKASCFSGGGPQGEMSTLSARRYLIIALTSLHVLWIQPLSHFPEDVGESVRRRILRKKRIVKSSAWWSIDTSDVDRSMERFRLFRCDGILKGKEAYLFQW